MTIFDRIINIAFAADCLLFAVFTLGKSFPSESFSSAAWRAELNGMYYGKARKMIDWLLGNGHCHRAYMYAKLNLPEDER